MDFQAMASIAQPTSHQVNPVPSSRTRVLATLLGTSTALAALAAGLIAEGRFGFGFFLFAFITTGASLLLMVTRSRATPTSVIPLLAALLYATFIACRASPTLSVLNFGAFAALIGFATVPIASKPRLRVRDLLFWVPTEWGNYFGSAIHVLSLEGELAKVAQGSQTKHAAAVLRGLLVAGPLLLIFGALFASADAGFEHLASGLTNVHIEDLGRYGMVFGLSLLLLSGFLHRLILPVLTPPKIEVRNQDGRPTEVATVLVTLNLLFGLFVATQFRHLFGGMQVVQGNPNLAVSEYARRGFFELVAVAFLTMAVLLGSYAYVPKELSKQRAYRTLASIMLVLVLLVQQSAFQKMQLYTTAFGITELRLYVLASMGWLVVVFVAFACTVLSGRKGYFGLTSFAAGLVTLLILNLINPDGQIARVNTSRPNVDISYLSGLSSDAVPELRNAMPRFKSEDQDRVKEFLANNTAEYSKTDWRSRTLSGYLAHQSR